MLKTPSLSSVSEAEIPQIIRVLTDNDLPVADVSNQIDFYAWRENDQFIGIGGLEQYAQTGLLRSVAILNPYKGQGHGRGWVNELLKEAGKRGIEELFLLTTTAEGFFQRMGFSTVEREIVPDSIRSTSEFQSVCPASAAVMSIQLSAWSEADSDIFADYGPFFVPHRDYQHQVIGDWLDSVEELETAIDLCCGDGTLCNNLMTRFPSLKMKGLDGSPFMLKKSEEKLTNHSERFSTQLFSLEKKDWRQNESQLSAVVSSLAIHHLNGDEKQELFKDVFKMLKPDGVFVIVDIVRPPHISGELVAAEAWDQYVKEKAEAAGKPEIFEYFKNEGWNYFRDPDGDPIDKPSSLKDQLQWLENAGFEGIDVSWVFAGHAIFGGRKPAH